MKADAFLKNFELLAEAPNGLYKIHQLVIDLAMQGKLVPQKSSEEPVIFLSEKTKANDALPPIRKEEMPYNIPKSWIWARLGNVVDYNGAPKVSSTDIAPDSWLLELEDIEKDSSRIIQKLPYKARNSKSTKAAFKTGDILYGKLRPYLNKVVVADQDGFCTTEILPLKPRIDLVPKYLMFSLKRSDFLSYVNAKSYGVKMPRLGTSDGRMALVPLPPPKEQARIVDKIEDLMLLIENLGTRQKKSDETRVYLNSSCLDRLLTAKKEPEFKTAWKRIADNFDLLYSVPENIAGLRQAILQLAVQGKLVPQDPKEEPAATLLQKIIQKKRKLVQEGTLRLTKEELGVGDNTAAYELPESWLAVRLIDMFDVRDGTHDSPKFFSEGYPLITSKNLSSGILDFLNVKYISESDHRKISERSKVDRNDILFAMIGSIGNPVVVDTDEEFSVKNVALFKYYSSDLSNPRYLCYFLRWASMKMRAGASGGVQSFVSLGFLRNYPFPLPPLNEQARIVDKLDDLFTLCDQLEEELHESSKFSERLMESIVHHLLNGQKNESQPPVLATREPKSESKKIHAKLRP